MIIYDLNRKKNKERTRTLQKLYGHHDNSNYNYTYNRKGLLTEFNISKERKTVLTVHNQKELANVCAILKKQNVKFEIAKIQ